jgi:hypothetical protein
LKRMWLKLYIKMRGSVIVCVHTSLRVGECVNVCACTYEHEYVCMCTCARVYASE